MRLWSLHPSYLDSKGLVALWREALLAQKVLAGRTKGYRQHPQLHRFKACRHPLKMIGDYLSRVAEEAESRGYQFERRKILEGSRAKPKISVSRGQLAYEWRHLRAKLKLRDPARYRRMAKTHRPVPHPSFRARPGRMEAWERPGPPSGPRVKK
jgi:hypothetical protein